MGKGRRLCRQLSIAFLVVGLTAALQRAARIEPRDVQQGSEDSDAVDLAMYRAEGARAQALARPEPTLPPAEYAVLGGRGPAPDIPGTDAGAHGLPRTNLGPAPWDADGDALLAGLPDELRLSPADLRRGTRGAAHRGLNYVAADPATAAASTDAVLQAIGRHGRIVASLPDAVFVVWVEAPQIGALLADPSVTHVRALEPAHRISPDLGALPRISRHEAARPDLLARITIVPGLDGPEIARRIENLPGVTEVTPDLFGGGYQARVDYRRVAAVARIDEIFWIEPVYDYLLANAEGVPTVQMGSAEDGNLSRPFDDAGVDGGGIDTNGDGRRINDGSDTVPPQIVGVVDNGISVDTASFSQTATQTVPPIGPPPPGTLRKIHAIQTVADSGTSCDAPLSGGSTHGNVVASILAADASSLGVRASRAGDGGSPVRSLSLDGVARGARILMEDAAPTTVCLVNSLVERGGNVTPGSLLDRLNSAICPIVPPPTGPCAGQVGGGNDLHIAVLPFGAPVNFGPIIQNIVFGTYPQEAVDVDRFLYNNRDTMVMIPVGNNGANLGTNRLGLMLPVFPDLFDARTDNDDPNNPGGIQVTPPSTAKNVVAVGSSLYDCITFFGTVDCEGRPNAFSSKGPASEQSLRMTPMLTAPSLDLLGNGPFTGGVAVFSSRDNDNIGPVDSQLDEGHFGSSYASAFVGGQALLVRDYFHQGFYPTGSRGPATDRMPRISGALVKAVLASSADFAETTSSIGTGGNELLIRRSRARDIGLPSGTEIIGNSEQGYGMSVLTHVLPLANWPDGFVLHPVSGQPREYPAAALLVWDRLSTAEPLIDNTGHTSAAHLFRLASPDTVVTTSGGLAVAHAQLRLAVAWPDRPGIAGAGGPLINDLDLLLEGPGPDNCLDASDTKPGGAPCPGTSAVDNVFYDGNRYGTNSNAILDQWSKPRGAAGELHDKHNPVEAVHLSSDPNNDRAETDSPLYLGRWRVTVKRGLGGAVPGSLTIGAAASEDLNGNGRLDAGEDANGNGLLDLPGQDFGLVVSGPVFLDEPPPASGPLSFPSSRITLDRMRYTCADPAGVTILDPTPGGSTARAAASTTVQVVNATGAVLDTESALNFTTPAPPGAVATSSLPVRLAAPAVPGNGILEADTGATLVATYAPAGQRAVAARAPVSCNPDLIDGAFVAENEALEGPLVVRGGCDDDAFPDSGEVVSYGIAIRNRARADVYSHVVATLTPSGPGAPALRVLDSPKDLGTLPAGATAPAFFLVYVDPAAIAALPYASRVATFTLTLDSNDRGARLARQTFTFTQALGSDRDERFFSTDYPAGGREVRDLDRDLAIERAGGFDPATGITRPREDVIFTSLFTGGNVPPGHFTNERGEDLDLSGTFTGAERDVLPNGTVDRGILNSNNPADPNHRVPWNLDRNAGGWVPFRHPASLPGSLPANPVWERPIGWVCGFQTAVFDADPGTPGNQPGFGVWHTGDGNPATPSAVATACDNHPQPQDGASPPKYEHILDVLESPIVAKVNQAADARGFPYAVEFQRFGMNLNIQLLNGYAGGGIDIDNDVDDDGANSLLVQHLDQYYERKSGGWPVGVFRFAGQYFVNGGGIHPTSSLPPQRTFGPYVNPNNSPTPDGDESGFPGLTQNTNPNSTSPIPTAPPDLLPYPLPGAPVPGVCDGGANDGGPCQAATAATDCPGGLCMLASNTIAGPVRNFDASLIGYEGGKARVLNGSGIEDRMFFIPGPAGTRWQIGIGFWAIESTTGGTDYGAGIDDPVFEWLEWHPEDEAVLGRPPACARFGGVGQPAGGQCATLLVDRASIFDCAGPLTLTVYDAKCRVVGPGATTTLGGACTTQAACGTGGVCSAALPSVSAQVSSPGDAGKSVTLLPVAGSPGLYRGAIEVSTALTDATHLFVKPGDLADFMASYVDPLCDGDRDGQAAEDDVANLDGDGVPNAGDRCPQIYDPAQADADGDGVGDLCDNCPNVSNPNQADADADGAGDACAIADLDGDLVPNEFDNCPGVPNPATIAGTTHQPDRNHNGLGDACDPAGALDDDFDGVPDDLVTFTGTLRCNLQPLASLTILDAGYQDLDGDHDLFPDTGETGRLVLSLRNNGVRLTNVRLVLTSSDPDVACITSPTLFLPAFETGATIQAGSFVAGQPGWTFTASNALQTQPPPAPPAKIDLRLDVLSAEVSGTNQPVAFSLLADLDTAPGVAQVFVVGPDGLPGTPDDGTVKESFDLDRDGDGNFTVLDTFRRPIFPGANRGTCSNAPRTYCQTAADCPAAVPAPTCQSGSYLRGSADGLAAGTIAAVTCGGYDDPAENPLCALSTAYAMDWHLHCPAGATHCPNVESGTCVGGCSYDTPLNGNYGHSLPNSLHMGAHFDPLDALAGDTTHLRTLQGFMSAPMNLAFQPRVGDLDLSIYQIARLMDANGFAGGLTECLDCGDVQVQVDLNADPDVDNWGYWDKLVPYQNVYDHRPSAWSNLGSHYCLFTPTDTGTAPPAPKGVHETICFPLGAWSHCGSTVATVPTGTLQCPGPGEVDPAGRGVWVQTRFDLHPYAGQRIRIRWIAETWNFGDIAPDESYWELAGAWSANQEDDGWWLDDIVLTGVVNDQVAAVPDTKPRTGTCPADPCDATQGDAGTAVVLSVTDPGGAAVAGPVAAGQSIRVIAAASTFPGGCANGIAEYEFRRNGVVVQPFGTPATFADAPEATALYSVKMRCSNDLGCTSVAGETVQVAVQTGEGGDTAFGTWASPFNPANGLLYDRALATTTLNWGGPGPDGFDVYRGSIGGTSRGHLVNGAWLLDVGPPPGAPPTCLLNGISGTPAPSGIVGGVNGTSGALNQAADPNPPVGEASYYLVVRAGATGAAVNAFGCANPALCRNAGWCEAGTDAGRPCTVNADCPGGGTCTTENMPCRTDTGQAHVGGCARHTVCAAGSNPGHLCESNSDCLGGGTCPALAAGVTTAGAVCMNVSLDPPLSGAGAPVNGCPARTSLRRIMRTAPAAGLCP